MLRAIIHADIDAFAASIEMHRDRRLTGKPVVVGNDAGGRGVVACASYAARGSVCAGMPMAMARRRLPKGVFLPEDRVEYERFSLRLLEIFQAHVPLVEAACLDDFYLDCTGCETLFGGDLMRWSLKLARTVRGETGLPLSLGMASNKMLARIATRMAKPGHLLYVAPGGERDFLAPVRVELLPGVGHMTRDRLHGFGVHRAGDICHIGEERLRLLLGPAGNVLWQHAMGVCNEPVIATALHRTVSQSQAFSPDTSDLALLESTMIRLMQSIVWKLRRQNLFCLHPTIELTYADATTVSRRVRIAQPTNQESDLIEPVRQAFRALYMRRVRVRRMRASTTFIARTDCQFDFLDQAARRSRRSLTCAVDEVRTRHGFDALVPASALRLEQTNLFHQAAGKRL